MYEIEVTDRSANPATEKDVVVDADNGSIISVVADDDLGEPVSRGCGGASPGRGGSRR